MENFGIQVIMMDRSMAKGFSVRFGQGIFPLHCHFDHSGEISRPNSTGRIVDGDLSAQSFNRIHTPLLSYRPAAPLEMPMVRAAACYFENFLGKRT